MEPAYDETGWKRRFFEALECATNCRIIEAGPTTAALHPEWFVCPHDAHYWVGSSAPEDAKNWYFAVFSYYKTFLVGCFKIRDDKYYYGSDVFGCGNHDLSMTELVNILCRAHRQICDSPKFRAAKQEYDTETWAREFRTAKPEREALLWALVKQHEQEGKAG